MEKSQTEIQELEKKKKQMEEKEKELEEREKIVEQMEEKIKLGFKENIYSKIHVSVKTMNIIITLLFIAVFITLVMGFVAGK